MSSICNDLQKPLVPCLWYLLLWLWPMPHSHDNARPRPGEVNYPTQPGVNV